ncbi:MAG: nicotinamide mononucleotide transporter [Streptomycetaceae bacterium]|jgi:nicotinamide mononucleotide transporter|nr:MAG: nicotinamide mononucleotide transporter [Streptomycetaceae bacterium]
MSSTLFTAWGYDVSIFEFVSVIASFIGVWLGTTGKRITWPWWAASSALYMIFFYQAELYASAALQIVFIVAAVWGWRDWAPTGAAPGALSNRNRAMWAGATLVSVSLLTPVLSHLGAAATWSDAFLLVASLIAQILMVYEKIESWVLWFIVDAVGTIQYAALGYWFTAILYLAFTLIAVIGWKRWNDTYSN